MTPEQAEHVEPSLAADTSTGTIVVFFFYFVIDFGVFFCIKKMDNGRFVWISDCFSSKSYGQRLTTESRYEK